MISDHLYLMYGEAMVKRRKRDDTVELTIIHDGPVDPHTIVKYLSPAEARKLAAFLWKAAKGE